MRGYRRLLELPGDGRPRRVPRDPDPLRAERGGGLVELDAPVRELPNATPFLFDEPALERAARRVEELVAVRL